MHGIAAQPASKSIQVTCPCRERAEPCLHGLATWYALVQRIDQEPALAFQLRGFDLEPERGQEWLALDSIDPELFFEGRAGRPPPQAGSDSSA